MQLLAIALYSTDGRRRVLDFKPGALNVITGESETGKSALLEIFEYCTGRNTLQLPVGPIIDSVSWYAALFQLDGTRAFVARPAPESSKTTSTRAMLIFGTHLSLPDVDQLAVNTDSATLRRQLGQHIGITENRYQSSTDRADRAIEAHLGHATLLCLQGQSDIASKDRLFHRQGEPYVAEALKATLPYFLGVVTYDQARKLAQLAAARDQLAEAESNYAQARRANDAAGATLSALWHEAHVLGMVPPQAPLDRTAVLETLATAVASASEPEPDDIQHEQRAAELQQECNRLRDRLRALAADRQTLLSENVAASEFTVSAHIPRDRLASLTLLAPLEDNTTDRPHSDESACPLCGSVLPAPDPTVAALRHSLHRLSEQLDGMEATRPARHAALEAVGRRVAQLRHQLLATEKALQALTAGQEASASLSQQAQADFARGRIHGVLSTLHHTAETELARLRRLQETAASRVRALEGELDPERERERLKARLVPVGQDISLWAHQLRLEHWGGSARLDLDELTLFVGTSAGPTPLSRIGSGANWVGYHVLAHLALHRYFVRHNRPVPRILILDQPTQAWYQSDATSDTTPSDNTDRTATERLFHLINEIVCDMAPDLQVIVCDHINLPDPWFQQAVVQNWRAGDKLIPQDWVDTIDRPRM
ncbi:DUF3732 domain-containing protein [Streptomyces mirabilis]|uniref:DUF3732 domain-containing protein n=1 Tax=Streptomyces mirabilis TaxID=68239 RepID=UPI0021BE0D12|nr:DUF3732 domain-containing protein [Streptomyces mirabilis]MCT9113043.1 DUF3732 domain-containing protein [Streptomyces mirabilis]